MNKKEYFPKLSDEQLKNLDEMEDVNCTFILDEESIVNTARKRLDSDLEQLEEIHTSYI